MKKPWYQHFITRYLPWILAGFIFIGSLLDSINNTLNWITPAVTFTGTFLVIVTFVISTLALRKRPIQWVTKEGHTVHKTFIGIKPVLMLSGILVSLWMPRLIKSSGTVPSQLSPSIIAFRVISQSKNEVTIEVDYFYNPIYGERVYIGACLYRNGMRIGEISEEYGGWCGYHPADDQDPAGRVPAIGYGTARVTIRPPINRPEDSDEIEIFLNRYGSGETIIVSRRFPFIQSWEP